MARWSGDQSIGRRLTGQNFNNIRTLTGQNFNNIQYPSCRESHTLPDFNIMYTTVATCDLRRCCRHFHEAVRDLALLLGRAPISVEIEHRLGECLRRLRRRHTLLLASLIHWYPRKNDTVRYAGGHQRKAQLCTQNNKHQACMRHAARVRLSRRQERWDNKPGSRPLRSSVQQHHGICGSKA